MKDKSIKLENELDKHFIIYIKKDATCPEEIVAKLVEGISYGNTKYITDLMERCGVKNNMMHFASKILQGEIK